MEQNLIQARIAALILSALVTATLCGCGGKEPSAAPSAAPEPSAQTAAPAPAGATTETAAATEAQPLAPTDLTWTPEALEDLLAPVAIYPDVTLGQVLMASTNPQEVLDAGNWLLQNQSLKGKTLDEAAKKVGFTPPIRGLIQSPEVIDMMCSQMSWTTELGQAYVNDQANVYAAVQRLRAQAKDVGNLKSSEQLKVDTQVQEGNTVINVSPPSPQVVYVPQYDPVAVYAPPPPTAAPAAPATTTTTTESAGHSTGALVTTGLLAFGAGLLVGEIFEDDNDCCYNSGYYAPRYYGPPRPPYPPYPYRPQYGGGFYPGNGYTRPVNYQHNFNNNTVIVNKNNNYWNQHSNASMASRSRTVNSPITAAKPNRPELASLNENAKREAPKRAASQGQEWKGQSSYAGAKPGGNTKVADARSTSSKSMSAGRNPPKVQGTYAGGSANTRDAKGKAASTKSAETSARTQASPKVSPPTTRAQNIRTGDATDRGRATPDTTPAAAASHAKPTAMSESRGADDRAASQRGKQSLPEGVPAKSRQAEARPKRPDARSR